MKNNYNTINELKEQLKEILLFDQVNIGKDEEDNLYKCANLILTRNQTCIDSRDLDIEDIDSYYIFQLWDEQMLLDEFMEDIENKLIQLKFEYNYIKVLFIVKNIKEKIVLENQIKRFKLKENMKKIVSKVNKIKITNDHILHEILVFSPIKPNVFEIGIDSRIRSLEIDGDIKTDDNEDIKIIGHVFIANLAEIVEIYNKMGNKLFDNNIRYGIKDELDVDVEIKKTLEKNPDEFWFLNNGITMLISDSKFAIKKTNQLEINSGKNKLISVINGAQTITTSAEFFYEKENDDRVKIARDKAKVMLRIIDINDVKKRESEEIIDRISLSLNRQKPIQPEDIAYTTKFIYVLNEIKFDNSDDRFKFTIIRRGDSAINGHTLVDFARATKAYLEQSPGKARSGGKKEFLKIRTEDDKYVFMDDKIFVDEMINRENDTKKVFNKYYKPVNFAIELQEYYLKKSSDIKKHLKDEKIIATLNYGKWHFVAYTIYVLNKYGNKDFTTFNVKELKNIEETTMDAIIKKFIVLFSQSIDKEKLDSNDFKNDDIYNNFKSYKEKFANNKISNDIRDLDYIIKDSFMDKKVNNLQNKEIEVAVGTTING